MNSDMNFDYRIADRNIKRGLVSKEEWSKHISSLEDCSELCEEAEASFKRKGDKNEEDVASDSEPAEA